MCTLRKYSRVMRFAMAWLLNLNRAECLAKEAPVILAILTILRKAIGIN